ncbi:MAG TPA: hypothetical protein VGD98_25250 [Ktedonobacteraceae bacterium]
MPLRQLLRTPLAEQAPVELISALDVDLATPPPVTSPLPLISIIPGPHVGDSGPPRAPSHELARRSPEPRRTNVYIADQRLLFGLCPRQAKGISKSREVIRLEERLRWLFVLVLADRAARHGCQLWATLIHLPLGRPTLSG